MPLSGKETYYDMWMRGISLETLKVSFAETVDRPAICYLPWKHGTMCRARLERWWFNPETEVCQKMIYGGCGKNENHFFDRTECATKCNEKVTVSLVECYQPKDKGSGHGWLMRYYYNWTKQKCLRFIYKGSGGNTNRFETKAECNRRCVL
nr:carboxypeptidase inhibitor SmCI isoform X1 [Crassostrea gigas]